MQQKDDSFFQIAKEIATSLGTILGTRPYIAIIDGSGVIHHIDSPLEEYQQFVQNFIISNFHLIKPGEHSLPLGGINIAFFKYSEKGIIVLYTKLGRSGQLLTFKARMSHWKDRIDALIGDIIITPSALQVQDGSSEIQAEPDVIESRSPAKSSARGLRTIPVLTKKLTGKEKFPLEVAQILSYCDGEHDIEDICKETSYHRLKVDNVIRMYQKKKWLEIKRVLS